MAYNKGLGRLSGNPVTDSFVLPSIPASASFVQPMLMLASPSPDSGWHVELTDPIIWGTITINGVIFNFPTTSGNVGDVLTLTAPDTANWEPPQFANLQGGAAWEIPYQVATSQTDFIPPGVSGQVLYANTAAAPSWGAGYFTLGSTPVSLGSTVTYITGVNTLSLTQDPSSALDAATKQYVDSRTGALNNLGSVTAATTTNIVLSGLQVIDGVNVLAGDTVLVKNQTNPAQDGVYVASTGAWTYPAYANSWNEYVGALVFVASGFQSGSSWTQTVGPGGTLGVTPMSWAQIGAALAYVGGPGINVTGGTISNTGVLSWSGGTTGLTPSIPTTGAITLGGTLQVVNGGTGRTSLGTGVQTAMGNAVNASGGFITFSGALGTPTSGNFSTGAFTWPTFNQNTTGTASNVTGVVAIANGGTGQTTANSALNALLPTQAGQNGKYLYTDGSNASWSANPLGTVTSIDVSGGTTGLTTSGGPITTSGTITLAGTLAIANGGTGLSTIGANGTVLTSNGATASWTSVPSSMVYPAAGIAVSTGSAWTSSITLGANVQTWLTTPSSANLAAAVTDETGSGSLVFSTSPTLVTPILGTPQSGNFSTGAFTWPTFNQNTTGTAANVTGVVAIANGGTGQTTANAAFNALAPSQVSANTKVLTSDGTNTSFQPLVATPTAGNIPVETATGSLTDSAKYFSDALTSSNNIWSASYTQAQITAGLLNTPTLPSTNLATTANLASLSGLLTIDGVVTVAGNYVLVKNQTTSSQNGIYRVTAAAWVRQAYVAGAYADVSTQTTYADLAENGGVINVLAGTANKNLQFQIYFQNPAATLIAGTTVYVTGLTKIPQASLSNRFVDVGIGNNTTNNGSSAFPYATIAQAIVGMQFPATITVAANPVAEASSITWSSSQVNCNIESSNVNNNGGQTILSGTMTFASNNTRVHFTGTSHSSATPFVFNSGCQCRNYFQTVTITNAAASDWLGLNAGVLNYISLDDIEFATPVVNAVNLPAFSNAFTIYHYNQNNGILRYTGTGAANTTIDIRSGCVDGFIWIPSTYLGSIQWNGAPFGWPIGSTAYPAGVISTQGDLTTILNYTADTTYDGWYAINFAGPSAFAQGAIFGKATAAGITTYTFWGRTLAQAPATIWTKAGLTWSRTNSGWSLVTTAATSYWASIYDTTPSQTAALANTAYAMSLGGLDPDSYGITIAAGTRITVANTAVYTFCPSVQVANSDNALHDINIWFRKNGVDIANSNSQFTIPSSHGGVDGYAVPAIAYTMKLNAGDYIELMWSVTDTAVFIYTVPATAPAPAAPGVLVSVTDASSN